MARRPRRLGRSASGCPPVDPYLAVRSGSSRCRTRSRQSRRDAARQPLRFLLADGADKPSCPISSSELIIRGPERFPSSPWQPGEQWQDELKEKYDLTFDIVSREQIRPRSPAIRSSSAAA
jgi:hypothetical protein